MWHGAAARYITSLMKTPEANLGDKTKAMTLPELCAYLKAESPYSYHRGKDRKGLQHHPSRGHLSGVEFKEYVPVILEKYKQKGVRMCVVTSTDRAVADEVLTRLGIRDYFMHIVTLEDSGGGKDTPEVFLEACEALGTPKDETVVFEDGLLSIGGAKDAGLYVIAVADESEVQNKSVIKKLADRYIESFEELL